MGRGGGCWGDATVRCGEMPLHRAVGRMEKGCIIPSFCPGIAEGGGGGDGGVELGGTMGTADTL